MYFRHAICTSDVSPQSVLVRYQEYAGMLAWMASMIKLALLRWRTCRLALTAWFKSLEAESSTVSAKFFPADALPFGDPRRELSNQAAPGAQPHSCSSQVGIDQFPGPQTPSATGSHACSSLSHCPTANGHSIAPPLRAGASAEAVEVGTF